MHKAIVGLGFGDEGKGMVTDYLASLNPGSMIVRYSGGHQAGHTVVSGDPEFRHVFSNFGSGSFRGLPTYWSEYCTVCPVGFMNELEILEGKGVRPAIYINRHCPVTTPYEVSFNRKEEKIQEHGSCGLGFGATIEREEAMYSLTFGDLFYPVVLKEKMRLLKDWYVFEEDCTDFLQACEEITYRDEIQVVDDIPMRRDLIFEGSQGLLLDQHYGFFPNVTRSNVGSTNICEITEKEVHWFLVTRAYQTRHGNGFMTNEDLGFDIKTDPRETNVTHDYQGEFRRSMLDVSLLEYGIGRDKVLPTAHSKTLVITCLDHLFEDDYRFTFNGEIITCKDEKSFVDKISSFLCIQNVMLSRSSDSKDMEVL